MARSRQENQISGAVLRAFTAVSVGLVLTIAAASSAYAQTYTVLHNFTGGTDGGSPYAGTHPGRRRGNLYGTTAEGAIQSGHCYPHGCGSVFKLKHTNSGWLFSPLYLFTGQG